MQQTNWFEGLENKDLNTSIQMLKEEMSKFPINTDELQETLGEDLNAAAKLALYSLYTEDITKMLFLVYYCLYVSGDAQLLLENKDLSVFFGTKNIGSFIFRMLIEKTDCVFLANLTIKSKFPVFRHLVKNGFVPSDVYFVALKDWCNAHQYKNMGVLNYLQFYDFLEDEKSYSMIKIISSAFLKNHRKYYEEIEILRNSSVIKQIKQDVEKTLRKIYLDEISRLDDWKKTFEQ